MLRKLIEIVLDISIIVLFGMLLAFICVGFKTGISCIYVYWALIITLGIFIIATMVVAIITIHLLFKKE